MKWFDEKWTGWMVLFLTGFAGMDAVVAARVVKWQLWFVNGLSTLIIGVLSYLLMQHFLQVYGFEWVVTLLLLGCALTLGKIYAAVKKD